MNTHADKTQENKSQAVSTSISQMQNSRESTFQFVDNRPEAVAQRKLQEMANNNPQVSQLMAFQDMANNSPQAKQSAQLQAMADNYSARQQHPVQKKANNTGLPNNLKSGIENLSGYAMDDVKVHYNSDQPAQLQAHAYTQGTDIHVAPGQEKHLPHEAWHVVQQKQGRVKPTVQLKGKVNINDDKGLEKEADVMGARAVNTPVPTVETKTGTKTSSIVQMVEGGPATKWAGVRSRVVGNKQRTTEDVKKAGIAEEMLQEGKQKIKEGIRTDNDGLKSEGVDLLMKASRIRELAQRTTAAKRLVGGNWEETGAFSEEKDDKGNRKVKMRDKTNANGEVEKVPSKYQLSEAERRGLQQEYDLVKNSMGEELKQLYQEYARKQLEKFDKSHAFISEWAFKNIIGFWKSWGTGTNFVSTLSDAEALFRKATKADGIATLEKELGIPSGSWSNKGETNSIYRFIVDDPKKFNVRLPEGKEGGAYQDQWVLGGKTLGGAPEAVIDAMKLDDLKASVSSGAITIKKVTFIGGGRAEQSTVKI